MKTLFITGANRGLGLEFVKQYFEAGWQVFATAREPEKAEALLALQATAPERLTLLALDVGDEGSVAALSEKLESAGVVFDLVINNAGIGGDAFYGEADWESTLDILRINTVAPLMVTQAVYPFVKKGEGAVIAHMSSLLGSLEHKFVLQKGGYGYSASKAALNMVTRQMALDYKEDKVFPIALSPGWVQTDMGGSEAPLLPPESIAGLIKVIESVTEEETGTYWHYDGTQLPW